MAPVGGERLDALPAVVGSLGRSSWTNRGVRGWIRRHPLTTFIGVA
jgi:hypothetical protein